MVRPTDWHNLDLHDDPTPGDSHEVKLQAQRYKTFVEDVSTVLRGMRSASKDSVLKESDGKAMDAFKEQIGKLPGQLQKLHDSYDLVAGALLAYAGKLEDAQATADHALAKARTLRGDLSRAQSRLASATTAANTAKSAQDKVNNPTGDTPAPDPAKVRKATRDAQHANEHQQAAQGQVGSLNAQLAELKTKAENAGKDQDKAATKLVQDIHSASDAGIHNKKWYEKLGDWVADHWDGFVTACKIIVAVAGIVALFVAAPWLVAIIMAAALVVLADTIAKFAQGKAGWGDLVFAILDCIPVVGRLSMLAKAGKLAGGFRTAIRVRKAEVACSRLIKMWRMGEDLKGLRKVTYTFATGELKTTLTDAMNGGWNEVQKNAVSNLVGNVIGAGMTPLVNKGFSKIPKIINDSSYTNMTRREYMQLGLTFAGKNPRGKIITGGAEGLVKSLTRATVSSVFFGAEFDTNSVILDGLSGAGGGGYEPGILPARAQYGT
ncbi:hypothetical protein EDD90_4761 [Streptomyces sp. Ag109_O5-1]|uniref:DUF308 domain-containing protein n=1 Tax=Streptomyces sp. Ag109_O5-1 TaxID=1938851 RepID=UPI000F512E3E|nr:DUF308 domain-containing protein [Streptomyces sp. Ag109_O5-1]RPE41670.1 hypothetical protein EDD90_4761 [Streptomyces sp. Ag109_O5-1]